MELERDGRATPTFEYGYVRKDGVRCTVIRNTVAIRPRGYKRATTPPASPRTSNRASTENWFTETRFIRRSDARRYVCPTIQENCMKTIFVRSTLLVIAAAFTVAGCQTTDAYTGEKKVNNATKGAGIGAIAGAVSAPPRATIPRNAANAR